MSTNIFAGRTAEQWREQARGSHRDQIDSWEQSDTDGFLSQWASSVMAGRYEECAEVAERGGRITHVVLVSSTTSEVLSTRQVEGRYGLSWRTATGFVSTSKAATREKRHAANAKKGVCERMILVAAYLDSKTGRPEPRFEALREHDFEIGECCC